MSVRYLVRCVNEAVLGSLGLKVSNVALLGALQIISYELLYVSQISLFELRMLKCALLAITDRTGRNFQAV